MADGIGAALSAGDFGAFFEEVHGDRPFPWQERLLNEVVAAGRWPKLLDLPTGAGKTAAIDVALFHLALDAARPPAERTAPRRIVMVVDRRTVVDQAFDRAKKIAAALEKPPGGLRKVVAERLRSLSEAGSALALAQLRGGMPRDDAWARWPDQALVAVSTVDQVGSRLLFRGYGVSEGMRPIHAGLLGNDVLLLLDEVHLSEPFRETLEAIRRYRGWAREALPDRWQFVEMSATPGSRPERENGEPFQLDACDRTSEKLARRLAAKKPIELGEPVHPTKFAEECAKRAAGFARPGQVVGVVVNRVATARAVAAEVKRAAPGAERFLVTGRMRPLDRDDLDATLRDRVRSGRKRVKDAPPVIVVATQCIEAGADFDFDALVTECASLDALRQRFGRLNRLGDIDDARGVVLVRSDSVGKDPDDAVYGLALAKTWRWLQDGPRDFGIDAMDPVLADLASRPEPGDATGADALAACLSPRTRAPVMLPAHLDAWAQTNPAPVPDPEVALWLHGIGEAQAPEVQFVWRADVTERLLESAGKDSAALEALRSRVEVCPPVGLEAISVSIGAARAWLQGDEAPDVADVEGRTVDGGEDERRRRSPRPLRPALLWKGDESSVVQKAEELRPGSTIVVPSTYGGIEDGNWNPSSEGAVSDLSLRARWQQTQRPVLRLHAAVLEDLTGQGSNRAQWALRPSPADGDDPEQQDREAVETILEEMAAASAGSSLGRTLEGLRAKGRKRPEIVRIEDFTIEGDGGKAHVEPGYLAVVGRFRVPDAMSATSGGDITTEGDEGSHTGVEVPLRTHLDGVASWARRFAASCGLPPRVARSVEVAASWHDAGKVDVRFQRMLRGGGDSRVAVAEPLAKSKIVVANRAARDKARKRSGYPRGARHELSSVALLLEQSSLLGADVDRDLVLHLVASHHGWCRPFAPVAEPDNEPVDLSFERDGVTVRASSAHGLERLDSGIADRFWTLVERYGWFGLAWLEAILRLADHRRSEQEQRDAGTDAKEGA